MTFQEIVETTFTKSGLAVKWVEPTSKKRAYVAFPQDEEEQEDPFSDKPEEKLERLCFEERELLTYGELVARSLGIADQLGYSKETKALIEEASHNALDYIVGEMPSEDMLLEYFEEEAKDKNSAAEREAFYASLGPKHSYVKKTGTRVIMSNKPKKKTDLESFKSQVRAALERDAFITPEEIDKLIKDNEEDFAWYMEKGCTPEGMVAILTNPLY